MPNEKKEPISLLTTKREKSSWQHHFRPVIQFSHRDAVQGRQPREAAAVGAAVDAAAAAAVLGAAGPDGLGRVQAGTRPPHQAEGQEPLEEKSSVERSVRTEHLDR